MVDSMIDEIAGLQSRVWALESQVAEYEETAAPEPPTLLQELKVRMDVVGPLSLAISTATLAHLGQRHSFGGEYILHPLRVMQTLVGQGASIAEQQAGVLHDVAEDTNFTLTNLQYYFGDEVADIVDAVTRRKGESYENMIKRIKLSPSATKVKLADLQDNIHLGIEHPLPEPRATKLRERYLRAQEYLRA